VLCGVAVGHWWREGERERGREGERERGREREREGHTGAGSAEERETEGDPGIIANVGVCHRYLGGVRR
jgi:hypothetical protein